MSNSKENQDSVPVSRRKWQISPSIEGLVEGDEGSIGPLLLTAREAAAMCSKSLRTWRAWDAAGWIPRPVRIGRSTLWRADELRDWVAGGCPRREEWEQITQALKGVIK
jgi:predicted DNA-binding transcriptional regulator AlpA